MSFKKTLALCLGLLLLAGCAITGTFAFPNFLADAPASDDEQQPQQSIDIELKVEEEDVLLYPGKAFEKKISIRSTEKSNVNAYVWYTYALPKALVELGDKVPLSVQFNQDDRWVNNWKEREIQYNGVDYVEYVCLYTEVLSAEDSTPSGMLSVTLDPCVSREKNGNFLWIEKGEVTPIAYKSNEIPIPVHAYAIITEGFEDVYEACKAYNHEDTPAAEATAD